jgi:2'-5' RNA ligase
MKPVSTNILSYADFLENETRKTSTVTKIAYTIEEKKDEEKPKYDYGCVMSYFEFPEMQDLHNKIEKEDLLEEDKSLETEPHVTLLYGLHSDEIEDDEVMKSVNKDEIKNLKLINLSAFNNKDADVLKFDVEGDGLYSNNQNLTKFPHTNEYDYHPHATVAYLKPGTAEKYIEMFKGIEYSVEPTRIVYSKPEGEILESLIKQENNENS